MTYPEVLHARLKLKVVYRGKGVVQVASCERLEIVHTVSSSVAAGELTHRNPLTLRAEDIRSPRRDGKLNAEGK